MIMITILGGADGILQVFHEGYTVVQSLLVDDLLLGKFGQFNSYLL